MSHVITDHATSGVLIFAKNGASASSISQSFERRLCEKTYVAVVLGLVDPKFEGQRIEFAIESDEEDGFRMKVRQRTLRSTLVV